MKCSNCKEEVEPYTKVINDKYNITYEFCPACGSILRDFTETQRLTMAVYRDNMNYEEWIKQEEREERETPRRQADKVQ